MYFHDVLLTLAAFLSEILGTLSGFGSSTFFVPAAGFFENFHLVLVLTAILHCFGNVSKIYLFKNHFDLKIFLRLALPFILLTVLGSVLNKYAPTDLYKMGLGALLILISLIGLFSRHLLSRIPARFSVALTSLSGFFTGFLGTGGALRGIALMSLNLEKNVFVMMSASIDIGGDFLRALIYLWNGYMDWEQWFYLPLLGIAAWFGSKLGKRILGKISQPLFEKIVSIFIFGSGVALLVQ